MICKFKAIFYWITFVFSVAVVVLLFSFTNNQNKIWKIRRSWAKFQRYTLNYTPKIEGEFDMSANLLIINHQSMLDIIALEDIYPKNLAWIAKKELGEIPLFKIAIKKPNLICIDRKNPRDLVRVIKLAKQRLDENRVLSIFPEGTRSRGEKMLKFQNGAAILSEKLKLKVQPILIIDSAKILDTKSLYVKGGELKIIALPCLDTSAENWLENARKTMQERLDLERKKVES